MKTGRPQSHPRVCEEEMTMAVRFGPNCRRKPREAHASELPGRMQTSPEVFFNAVSPSQSWQSLEHAQGMGTVPETHVTVQSPEELKEGPEDPWREAGCWKAGGRDRMVNDQLTVVMVLRLLSWLVRDMKAQRRRRNVTFLRLHTCSPH